MFKREFNGIEIREGERLEDLGNGAFIIQNPEKFCFGIDAVLLSWFAKDAIRRKSVTVEVGTGTGIIPLLLCQKTNASKITAFEIQPEMAEMARRSVALNDLDERIEIVTEDVREQDRFAPNSVDVIVSNPPYIKTGSGLTNPKDSLKIARHEFTLTAQNLFDFAASALKDKGKLFIVHKADRLAELTVYASERGLEMKRLCMVHPRLEKPANLVLCEFVKGGKPYLQVDPPVIVYDGEDYTDKIHTIYGTQEPVRQVIEP